MGKPAATFGSLTAHGGTVTGPGCPTVLINGKPAVRVGDMHVCPMVTPAPVPVPHVGGPIVGPGCPSVLVGGLPAAVMGDMCVCVGPPSTIIMGSPNVLIGMAGGGGGGGGSGSNASDKTIKGLQAGTIKPVKGSETLPIAVQAVLHEASQHLSPEETDALVENTKKEELEKKITIADFVEILKAVEAEQGKEAARFYASTLDYSALSDLARSYISGENTDPKNDPNQMPTRFMILYGADDAKLKSIDDHPDRFEKEEHKMNVANLRKGLRLIGYELKENGPYDDEVYQAHLEYMGLTAAGVDGVYDEEGEGERKLVSHKFTLEDVDPKDPDVQDDTFTLFSNESTPKYKQVKTIKDDADTFNNTLDLIFNEIDTSLTYSLEIDIGSLGIKEILFKNKKYGSWK